MDIKVLQYFLAVAREGSISRAAEQLYMTQPPLSRMLRDLEQELGKKLFIRGNRNITLTDEGILLRKRAEEMLDLLEKTKAEISSTNNELSGNIYIGGGETDNMHLIAKSIKKLQEKHPNIQYHFYSGNANDVMERLDKGLLDFGIIIGTAHIQKYDYLRLPTTDTWGLLIRKDSPLSELDSIQSENIENLPLLCSRQALEGNELSGWLGEHAKHQKIVATYDLIYNAAIMVEEGLGNALCLDKLVTTSPFSTLCFRPLEPRLETPLYIIWKKYQVFSKPAETFLRELQEQFLVSPK
ncbi:LysR family transcriptional regulator [Granulicatella seriolae]|uniref:LysR family transcriptional regulator n=1 Tax=Granulicatella seriolae TaxID=2967226 RepID=A0ABT1WQC7_9LACT|nr:LysR family transcriptional regulator [Granulicatella seriolae]